MKTYANKKIISYLIAFILFVTSFSTALAASPSCENNEASSKEKVVYLTFDDGPAKGVNDDVLDILKEHNIKATFFVLGEQFKGNEDILKRIHSEGHTLGLHSYTHNFSKLYKGGKHPVNIDFFMDEMLQCQKELEEITGIKSTILRFPGGSHKRLSEELSKELEKHNLKVYDWTHSSEDAVNLKAHPDKLLKNSLRKIPSCKKSPGVILLMHCNSCNKNSVKALPQIIEHYKQEGYKFLPITSETPEYRCD